MDEGLPQWSREKYAEYFARFWYDNAIACDPPATDAIKSIAGPDKLLFGTDWPFINPRLIAEQVATHVLPSNHTDAERAAVDRGNALKLWPHLA